MRKIILPTLVVLLIVLALPLVFSSYGVVLWTEIFIMAIFAMSLGLIMGFAGLPSLGHAAFFGMGAYTVAVLGHHVANSYLLLAAAIGTSALLALISGILFIRTTGGYFLMITLALGQMLYALAWKMKSVTGGADGMKVPVSLDLGFGSVGPVPLFYMMGLSFVLCYFLIRLFISSPAGLSVKGIMGNVSRMKALGYHTNSYLVLVYTISGMIAGFAGGLYAYFNRFVSPDLISWVFSGQVLLMVIIGGVGTVLGPAVGAGVYILFQNYLSTFTERWLLIMGVIFIIVVLFGQGGIAQFVKKIEQKLKLKSLKAFKKINTDREET